MNQPLELPALNGLDPLGFLAALGTLRLLRDHTDLPAQLSFDQQTATAQLRSPLRTVDDLTAVLTGIIDSIPENGVIPGVPAQFPIEKNGVGRDTMRVARATYRQFVNQILGTSPTAIRQRWLAALITDLAADAKDGVALSLLAAPRGQQSFRSFFRASITEVRKAPTTRIRDALTRWQRIEGCTGENLDHRAARGAADHPSGEAGNAGVPGATWLAIMALPLLRLTGDAIRPKSTLWHSRPGRRPVMIWPIWHQPMDHYAVQALLEHPSLAPAIAADGTIALSTAGWGPLGIFAVGGATRRSADGNKSAGVLTPFKIDAQA